MSETNELKPLALTLRQAADALQLSESTVKRQVAAGKLRAIKIGRCVRFAVDELQRFLAASAEPACALT